MFTWICPQCKREVPPSDSECPDCAERARAAVAALPAPVAASPAGAVPPAPVAPPVYYAPPRKSGAPGWLVTLGVAAIFTGLGGGFYYWHSHRNQAPDSESAAQPAAAPALETPAAAGAQTPVKGNPAMKFLEVAGIRVFEENRKPMVRIQLINHASTDLAGLNGNIHIHALGKENESPVASVPIKLPVLQALDAVELTAPLKTRLRAYEMPDWQFLRAKVELDD